ncbi:MATE family efflux transporter [Halodesulfovibrio marinisediminis]|uniref:Multidrug resistance protein, MATE family n=1 Tax=Halodesulfovibrio marinisediminis DSM 17456 TaxID=1121457 RepID=A0A1N6I492_9BACT|nr:MATE family efflux transporter [Halodesulfovibrio marinisediminis]SIO26735.1 multidrug resistance protein, MATE family [Halodesulfovibrio marinisediminis DSM 17456]
MSTSAEKLNEHAYKNAPAKTFASMSIPVLLSLIAEPLTGLVDTAFVATLGTEPLAALGIGTMVLTSAFWIFNFLGIGTQTEISHCIGADNKKTTSITASTALLLALAIGLIAWLLPLLFLPQISQFMGAEGAMQNLSISYMTCRLAGGPAVLFTMAAFGIFRGLQDMRTPLVVTTIVNALNVLLDWLLIFGIGPFPELGVAGAALATTISQYVGMAITLYALHKKLQLTPKFDLPRCKRLLSIGWDMTVRTGLVIAFLLYCTRTATQAGAIEGAAHQGIRQFVVFNTLLLDTFAITGQSLTGYFKGKNDNTMIKQVIRQTFKYSFITGIITGGLMIAGADLFAKFLIPTESWAVFFPAWTVVALSQPTNSLSYATDGILWGIGDFAFTRNAMCISCIIGIGFIGLITTVQPLQPLLWIWLATGGMMLIRSALGCYRCWQLTKA